MPKNKTRSDYLGPPVPQSGTAQEITVPEFRTNGCQPSQKVGPGMRKPIHLWSPQIRHIYIYHRRVLSLVSLPDQLRDWGGSTPPTLTISLGNSKIVHWKEACNHSAMKDFSPLRPGARGTQAEATSSDREYPRFHEPRTIPPGLRARLRLFQS